MLNGIEVLNTIKCGGVEYGAVTLGIVSLIAIIIFLIFAIVCFKDYENVLGVVSLTLMLFLICVEIACVSNYKIPEYNQYQVTISPTVSLTEFNEKYEILDVDGEIYTIRERDDE